MVLGRVHSSRTKQTDDHIGMDKHQVGIRRKRVEKYLRRKLLLSH